MKTISFVNGFLLGLLFIAFVFAQSPVPGDPTIGDPDDPATEWLIEHSLKCDDIEFINADGSKYVLIKYHTRNIAAYKIE